MNPDKVGKLIREIRKDNNLSQQQFASKYGVTYQAVSKWENGKNIPDILLLKQICNDFQISMDDLLEGNNLVTKKNIEEKKERRDRKFHLLIFFLVFVIIFIFILIMIHLSHDDDFSFKTLSTGCENFNVTGSIAYNESKSSIYISSINYCGEEDNNVYKQIDCSLYEEINNTKMLVTSCGSLNDIMLDEFLNDLKLGIDDYKQNCKNYVNNKLYLEISATDNSGKVTLFEIPLLLEDNCKF